MIKKLLLLSCAASSLLATNGVNMIGTGTVSRSMGGTGVAFFSDGSGAMGKNVALIADVKESELHLDVTYFSASVSTSTTDYMIFNETPANPTYGQARYDAGHENSSQNHLDTNFIPTVSYVSKINDNWSWGATMMGAAGMGVDYKGHEAQRQLKTGMMLMKIIPGISYRTGNTTFGFAPVLGLGSMSLNYDEAQTQADGTRDMSQSTREGLFGSNIGGDSLVPAFGWQAGVDIKVTEKLRVGATYQSSLKYKYEDVANFKQFGPHGMVNMANDYMDGDLQNFRSENIQGDTFGNGFQTLPEYLESDFGIPIDVAEGLVQLMPSGTVGDSLNATDPVNLDDLTMEQPWEIAIGFGYELTDQVTVTGDYRYIAWGLAEGYKEFGWENQSVYALGFEFRPNKQFRFRGGYNYADSPIKDNSGEMGSLLTNVQGSLVFDQAVSMLNMTGFPAIATTHFTLGAGYDFTDNLTVDAAFMYSPETETSRSGSLVPGASSLLSDQLPASIHIPGLDMDYEYTTKMEQMTLSLGINYRF
ncbi:MAG: outer membrane protein transport protein [Sulfurimonadaceae bacterium]